MIEFIDSVENLEMLYDFVDSITKLVEATGDTHQELVWDVVQNIFRDFSPTTTPTHET